MEKWEFYASTESLQQNISIPKLQTYTTRYKLNCQSKHLMYLV